MKYIAINIKNFIKNETAIFALVILCILSSAIIINFAFGFYHHLKVKKLEEKIIPRVLLFIFMMKKGQLLQKEA